MRGVTQSFFWWLGICESAQGKESDKIVRDIGCSSDETNVRAAAKTENLIRLCVASSFAITGLEKCTVKWPRW